VSLSLTTFCVKRCLQLSNINETKVINMQWF
jgi:hypothetical protein